MELYITLNEKTARNEPGGFLEISLKTTSYDPFELSLVQYKDTKIDFGFQNFMKEDAPKKVMGKFVKD